MKKLKPLLFVFMFVCISFFLYKAFKSVEAISYKEVTAALEATPVLPIFLSILATFTSYLILTGYDFSSLHYVQSKVKAPWVMITSFIAYAISNNVGFAVLSGGAIRMRLYAAAGLKASTITKLVAFNTSSFILGMLVFSALGLLVGASAVADSLQMSVWVLQAGAIAVLLAITAFVGICFLQVPIRLTSRMHLRLPTGDLAIQQIVISASDLFASAFALWILLPDQAVSFTTFLMFYALAMTLALLSNVPGGLGVFEGTMMLMLPQLNLSTSAFIAALLLYRMIYYVLPLAVATVLLAVIELRNISQSGIAKEAWTFFPRINIILSLAVSVLLVFAGFAEDDSPIMLSMAHDMIPHDNKLDFQHLLIVPALMIYYFTRGLFYRLRSSWQGVFYSTLVSMCVLLAIGATWVELNILAILLIFLIATRSQYTFVEKHHDMAIPGKKRWIFIFLGLVVSISTLYVTL